jgi:hypothetical protein
MQARARALPANGSRRKMIFYKNNGLLKEWGQI